MSPVEQRTFRDALAQLAGGVVIVTTVDDDGSPRGMTATAVCSVSLTPPMVMACMGHASVTHGAVERSGVFALNILPESAAALAGRFASASDEKFDGLRTTAGETGAPLLDGALVHCDCVVERTVAAGDHTIFIGRVVGVGLDPAHPAPLLYFRGAYGSVGPLAAADS